jgi:predicted ATPase
VALFVQRMQAMLPEFQLTGENARVIAEICMRMEGVPLAIELAVAHANVLPLKMLLSRLEHPLEVLTGGRRDAPGHQKTLRNSVGWNYDLLSSDEQTLFRRLAVFVKGCSLQAVEAQSITLGGMALSALDGVRALVDKSLLRCSAYGENELRLYPLEMIRAYGLELLTECGELEQTREAHAAYYLSLAEEADSDMHGAELAAWQERLEQEVANLRAAMEWLLENKKREEALRLTSALWQLWSLAGYINEGRSFLKRA